MATTYKAGQMIKLNSKGRATFPNTELHEITGVIESVGDGPYPIRVIFKKKSGNTWRENLSPDEVTFANILSDVQRHFNI